MMPINPFTDWGLMPSGAKSDFVYHSYILTAHMTIITIEGKIIEYNILRYSVFIFFIRNQL